MKMSILEITYKSEDGIRYLPYKIYITDGSLEKRREYYRNVEILDYNQEIGEIIELKNYSYFDIYFKDSILKKRRIIHGNKLVFERYISDLLKNIK